MARRSAAAPRRCRARCATGGHRDGRRSGRIRRGPDAEVAAWAADVGALLAERERAGTPEPVRLPGQLSVSALVELDRDPRGAARRLTRRLPARPDPHAILGTAFHEWVQRFYGADRLFDLDDLPGAGDGAGDGAVADAAELEALQDAFGKSAWAARTPIEVEVPFEMAIGDTVVREAASTRCSPTRTVVSSWWTGRPASRRPTRAPASPQRFSWPSTGGLGGADRLRGQRCGRPSTMCAPGTRSAGSAARAERAGGAAFLIFSAETIIGTCSGSRASATARIGHFWGPVLPHHSRTMLMFAGNTARNSAAAASAPVRRVCGASIAPAPTSATPEASV